MILKISIVYTHISFIHYSIGGHLGCFHNVTATDNAAIDLGSRGFPALDLEALGNYPGVA